MASRPQPGSGHCPLRTARLDSCPIRAYPHSGSQVAPIDKRIDALAYELYGLAEEEIGIV